MNGDASNITIKDEYQGSGDPDDYDWYYDLALYYTSHGKLWRALRDKWHLDEYRDVTDYTKLSAREFYYDGAMQRYLARDVDTDTWDPLWTEAWQWTDYERGTPYHDFDLALNQQGQPVNTPVRRYLAEFGVHGHDAPTGGEATYLHGDLIDSTMLTTDDSGTAAATLTYSAFGEPIGDPALLATRYQYAGGAGYESDLLTLNGAPGTAPIILLHVGARWYQPNIGRFVQRDPLGVAAGPNTYVYCAANPVVGVDPLGLWWSVWRWLYTGEGDAPDEVYDAAVDAAADWLLNKSPVRGGYVGAGTPWNRGLNASGGVSWTINSGFRIYVSVSAGYSRRTRDPLTGRYSSLTAGGGYSRSWGEGGSSGGFYGGIGQNQKAHGGFGGIGADGSVSVGGTAGCLQGGLIVDPGKFLP